MKAPDAAWLETAAKRAGLQPELEEKARDPFAPHKKSGRVLVAKKGSKEKTLRMVAQKMAKKDE